MKRIVRVTKTIEYATDTYDSDGEVISYTDSLQGVSGCVENLSIELEERSEQFDVLSTLVGGDSDLPEDSREGLAIALEDLASTMRAIQLACDDLICNVGGVLRMFDSLPLSE